MRERRRPERARRRRAWLGRAWLGGVLLVFGGCGGEDTMDLDATVPPDAGVDGDAGGLDAGGADVGPVDAGGPSDPAFAEAADNPGTWTWVPVEGARCRDDSETGFLIRLQPGATRLAIFLDGGGACFNPFTCPGNPASFGEDDARDAAGRLDRGIFDASDPDNPVADWNMAFVPYCTGDVFGGSREDAVVPGVADLQQFVGFDNMTSFADLLARQLTDTTEVLLTGSSAGGFGATLNFDQVARRFSPVPVHLLNDSGQPLRNGGLSLAPCLTEQWFSLWDVQTPAGCLDCGADGAGLLGVARYIAQTHPESKLALASYLEDAVIRGFLLFGRNMCRPTGPQPVPAADFRADVLDLRTELPSWGTFFLDGPGHTFLGGDLGYQVLEVEGRNLADYLEAFLADEVLDLGP